MQAVKINVHSVQVVLQRKLAEVFVNLDSSVSAAANGAVDNGRASLHLKCALSRWPLVLESLGISRGVELIRVQNPTPVIVDVTRDCVTGALLVVDVGTEEALRTIYEPSGAYVATFEEQQA